MTPKTTSSPASFAAADPLLDNIFTSMIAARPTVDYTWLAKEQGKFPESQDSCLIAFFEVRKFQVENAPLL
jgi:hypothetical protein